ncbi:MAG: (Fe-S)-binding protein [Clostridiales bacterium]|nr:(Fe-S)-binding protein [Clostridiales bacterium]
MALEDYRETLVGCSKCSYCKFIPLAKINGLKYSDGCPSVAHYGFHTYSGGGRLTAALSLLEGRSGYTEKVKDMVYQCQLCGSCDVTCKVCRYDMEPQAALEEIRARFVEDGQTLEVHDKAMESLRSENNMMSAPASARGDWAAGLGLKEFGRDKCETLFFAGCRCSFDKDGMHVAKVAAEIFQAGGVDFCIMGGMEPCCGGPAYSLGYRADFALQMQKNITVWKEAGIKRIVTPCADCYRAFNRLYRQEGDFGIEALHAVQLADRLIKDGSLKIKKTLPLSVTYHDPCKLGRLGEPYEKWDGATTKIYGAIPKHDPPKPRYNGARGVYDEPRDVLRAIPGLKLLEMARSREAAWCCGAGGGVREAFPDFGFATAKKRLEEAADTGAEILASACPLCERGLADAARAENENLKVYDVLELLRMAL